jgi:hypothetical protein
LFSLKSHTATLHSGNQALIGEHRFNDISAILDCKFRQKFGNKQKIRQENHHAAMIFMPIYEKSE